MHGSLGPATAVAFAASLAAPAACAQSTAILERHLEGSLDGGRFSGRIENTEPCAFDMIFDQRLDLASYRSSRTRVEVDRLDLNRSETVTFQGMNLAELRLNVREGAEPMETVVTLTSSDPATRQQYIDAFGSVCDGDVCTGSTTSDTISFVVLGGDDPVSRLDFLLLDMRGLIAACSSKN